MFKYFNMIEAKERSALSAGLAFIAILAAIIFPRLMVLGGLPTTDEGFYAYQAQVIHSTLAAGEGLPNDGFLAIYPMLLSWVFEFTANHFVLLRLVDLFVAAVASYILFLVLRRESGSLFGGALISFVFLFIMNQPLFIQTGFKNSIFAAYVPLFFALKMTQNFKRSEYKGWGYVGILVVLAVFLRETFLYFFLVASLSAYIIGSWRALLYFIIAAGLTGLIIILSIIVARGGYISLIDSYINANVLYSSITDQRLQLFTVNGQFFAMEAKVALVLCVLSILIILRSFVLLNNQVTIRHFVFWITVTVVPLLEPALKIGMPYHFAVCLPGLAGLTAIGWRTLTFNVNNGNQIAAVIMMIALLVLLPKFKFFTDSWQTNRVVLADIHKPLWPIDSVTHSNYLLAAEIIRSVAPPNSTLSVSGFMYALYPLTGLLPPSSQLSNLSATLIQLGLDESYFKQALIECPPDVLMTTTRTTWPGARILKKVVEDSGMYEEVAEISNDPKKSYGNFGGTVFKKIRDLDRGCQTIRTHKTLKKG